MSFSLYPLFSIITEAYYALTPLQRPGSGGASAGDPDFWPKQKIQWERETGEYGTPLHLPLRPLPHDPPERPIIMITVICRVTLV